jgi:D-alanyl-D-alanine carboxypeptidase
LRKYAGLEGMKTGFINASGFNIVATANKNKRRIIAVVLGKRTQDLRDKTTVRLLDKAFNDLILDKKNVPLPKRKPLAIFKKSRELNLNKAKQNQFINKKPRGEYSIQVGAFSSFTKAKSVASEVHQELNLLTNEYDIRVLPSGSKKIYYRARLTGLLKSDALKACKHLEKAKRPCLVIAPKK